MTSTTIGRQPVRQDEAILSVEEVASRLSRRFKVPGLTHMTVANVTALGYGMVRAEVMTRSGAVVLVIEVDRRTGEAISYR